MKNREKSKNKKKNDESYELVKIEKFLDCNKKVEKEDATFKKLMFIYSIAIRELDTKIGILKDEFQLFHNYDLIDHVNSRLKTPDSIMNKMKKKDLQLTYKSMIENINDIAGIRVICPLKKDVYTIKDSVEKFPGIQVLKEKDYLAKPKKSGYSSHHLIVETPVPLSQNVAYVKVEIQIRTMAMDFWASLEHKMKYKPDGVIDKKNSKEWVNCAKVVNKLDNKMMLLNEL